MNLFELILKNMRQRMLSTMLTLLSVGLGVAMATSIMIVGREGRAAFGQTDYGCDLIVGPKGSELQLVLNTLYHMSRSPGNIPYGMYEDLTGKNPVSAVEPGRTNPFLGHVQWAVPYAVGDNYAGFRIVATTPQLFGVDDAGQPLPGERVPEYRLGRRYAMAEGRCFGGAKFEAVIGAEVAAKTGLKVGSEFHAMHGLPGDTPDEHAEVWKVVGVLAGTHTANDKVLFIPLPTFYAIFEHEEGIEKHAEIRGEAGTAPKEAPAATAKAPEPEEKAYTLGADGTVVPKLPKAEWEVSAVLVKSHSPTALGDITDNLKNRPVAAGVNPALAMREFLDTFLSNAVLLLVAVSALVTVMAGVSILVSIYNAVTARNREIAIMRALGATRVRILAIVCLEATLVGLVGAVLGSVAGHLLAAGVSGVLEAKMGTGLAWWRLNWWELLYLVGTVALSLVAGLVPALKAYGTPVATNLSGN